MRTKIKINFFLFTNNLDWQHMSVQLQKETHLHRVNNDKIARGKENNQPRRSSSSAAQALDQFNDSLIQTSPFLVSSLSVSCTLSHNPNWSLVEREEDDLKPSTQPSKKKLERCGPISLLHSTPRNPKIALKWWGRRKNSMINPEMTANKLSPPLIVREMDHLPQ